ncbi:YMGG-like glycine zipper-containing protein [Sulfurospirillum sp. 1612]|uniref:YMGG-like glycine zipper-containing protein n=1 Tax=Sulfurospirillum sp. 1612 TaxID=3094835 RepID=UPI002F931818
MKKIIISVAIVFSALLGFGGCASNGMAVNTPDGNKVSRVFHQAYVVSQEKVIVDNSQVAVLTGVGVGAVGGALVGGDNVKGALIGAAIGGIIGALSGNEIEAYKTTLDNGLVCYVKQRLMQGTELEYTIVDNKLKNVNVVAYPQ